MTGLLIAIIVSLTGLLILSLGANFEWYKESQKKEGK
mgnify:CR=1 FL=1